MTRFVYFLKYISMTSHLYEHSVMNDKSSVIDPMDDYNHDTCNFKNANEDIDGYR